MKCPTCKKDYETGVKAAYKLGLLAGKEDQGRLLWVAVNRLQKTFGHLFDEVQRCDKGNPLNCDPNYVHIKISIRILYNQIIKMRKYDRNLAKYYQDKLNEHDKMINSANETITKTLNCR